MSKPLKVLYAAGPGNVIKTYQYWSQGQDDPSQVSVTYSGQFYDVCSALDAQAYVISSCEKKKILHDDRFIIEHRPIPFPTASGVLYHLVNIWYGLRLIVSAVNFKANIAVVADGTTSWFILSLLPWLGIQVVPSLHCVLWCKYLPKSQKTRLFLKLNQQLFSRHCFAILAVSDDIVEQLLEITNHHCKPIVKFLPTYRPLAFAAINSPNKKHFPFRVLFAGRIESNKGVFDLVEIAKRFMAEGRDDIRFDICGEGSALNSLRLAAEQANINTYFTCHGHCNKRQMGEMFNQAHAVIVPTRTDFTEGFNKVVVESVLSGRPVVTSAVCPALSYVQSAVVEVPPNDIQGYGDALLKLCDDLEFYEAKQKACVNLQEQFYDPSQSWGFKLKTILTAIKDNQDLSQIL